MEKSKTALITGASKGLGFKLAERLAQKGWNLLITGRDAENLQNAKKKLVNFGNVIAIAGDVRDEIHLLELADVLKTNRWKLDLVINNASSLGHSPLKSLLDHSVDNLHIVLHTNMIAPISLLQKIRSLLKLGAKIINVSSDAAVEAYETWGAYGASKAGLDHMTSILSKENPDYLFYSFDPGDMQTDMHQAAFPNQDISDRPMPGDYAVPALINLIENDFAGGRYTLNSFQKELV